ncbi:MAG: ABC transporter substrate-binding protein [Alphaproteobacteria bacterium]|nr:ABC transporter substrate-binding protein [Alphaproteobacteria bacterium]
MVDVSATPGARLLGRLAALLLAFARFAPPLPARAGAGTGEAERAIADLADRALPGLVAAADSAARERAVRQLLHESFDLPGMGRFMLGRFWRQASETERQEYLSAFEDLVVQTFAAGIEEYPVERLSLRATRQEDGESASVHSEIFLRPNPERPFRVEWRLRQSEGRYRIYDIVVEGLSLSVLLRDAFVQTTQAGGGNVRDFIQRLRLMKPGN